MFQATAETIHLQDILLAALLGVLGYIGKVAIETRTLVKVLAAKLEAHLRGDDWNGLERRGNHAAGN